MHFREKSLLVVESSISPFLLGGMAAQEAKMRGVAAYREKRWVDAVAAFSDAIAAPPSPADDGADDELHLFHSNRCAALLQLNEVERALADAEACTAVKPSFAKGWSRLGSCLARKGAGRRAEAIAAFEKVTCAASSSARPTRRAFPRLGPRFAAARARRDSPHSPARARVLNTREWQTRPRARV